MVRGFVFGVFLCFVVANAFADNEFSQARFISDPIGSARKISNHLNTPNLSAAECAETIAKISAALKEVSPIDFGPQRLNTYQPRGVNHPSHWIPETVRYLQAASLGLRKQLRKHFENDRSEMGPIDEYRRLFRMLRYADESLSYLLNFVLKNGPESGLVQTYSNPRFERDISDVNFSQLIEMGDLALTRADAAVSGFISRMGEDKDSPKSDLDSQFSHLAMMAMSPDGDWVTLEAQLQNGVNIHELEEFENRPYARVAVFRANDSHLARAAAGYGYKLLVDRVKNDLPPIRYSFTGVNAPDGSAMVCSGMAACFFSNAAQGIGHSKFRLPTFSSRYNMKDPWILNKLGIAPGQETFAPGDLEVDPQFDLVFERRDLERTYSVNMSDIVSTEIYRRLDEGYRFIPDAKAKLTRHILLRLRRLPEFLWSWWPKIGPKLKKGFPTYIDADALEMMTMIVGVSSTIQKELIRRDQAYIRTNKVQMGWKELQAEVRAIIDEDHSRHGPIWKRFRPAP